MGAKLPSASAQMYWKISITRLIALVKRSSSRRPEPHRQYSANTANPVVSTSPPKGRILAKVREERNGVQFFRRIGL